VRAAVRKGEKMCVGLAAKVVRAKDGMAVVDATGARREISTALLSDVNPGDYVMVHAGMAIAKITADDEEETREILDEI
jgi:hydrogenase expression/formation protein HypC